jgi:hypothetical protein
MSSGIVYILANPSMVDPNDKNKSLVKIGITQDLRSRLSQLYGAGNKRRQRRF